MASPTAPPPFGSTPTQSPSQPQPSPPTNPDPNANPFLHNVALGVTPLALLGILLPPRRLDMRFAVLGGVALWGSNELVRDYTGRSTLQRFNTRMAMMAGTELPEKAKQTQMRLRAERAHLLEQQQQQAAGVLVGGGERERKLVEEQRVKREAAAEKQKNRGPLERIWMGDAEEDWKEKRDRREKEALKEGGGGYWGLITEQVSEVWNGGKKAEGDKGKEKETESGESKKP